VTGCWYAGRVRRVPYSDEDVAAPTVATAKRAASPNTARGLRVTLVNGPNAGAASTIAQRTAILGRGATADVRVDDPTVSSFHVEIATVDDGISVRDLESRNGTIYAGARIGNAVVPHGASIQIGGTIAKLELDVPFDSPASGLASFGELQGESDAMRSTFALLLRLATSELSVLLEGPTGTGKELAARALHDQGRRARGPFVVLDCTAIPATLAESVLFGHEKGAFTGAVERRVGAFESAHGGTIFLDEVGELPIALQPKLLRVLERREVMRVGGNAPRAIDVRVVCATWRDLRAMVNKQQFREDLYYRLAQARVPMPALRDHREDIPKLVEHFLSRLPQDVPCARSIGKDALDELMQRDFAGNVRELKNTVERAAMMAAGALIVPADLAFERLLMGERARAPSAISTSLSGGTDPLVPFKEAKRSLIEEFEREYLQRLMQRTGDNLSRASALAGIERHYLRDLVRKYGLRSDD